MAQQKRCSPRAPLAFAPTRAAAAAPAQTVSPSRNHPLTDLLSRHTMDAASREVEGIGSEAAGLRDEVSALKQALQDKDVEMANEVLRLKELLRKAADDRAAGEHRLKLAGADALAAKEAEVTAALQVRARGWRGVAGCRRARDSGPRTHTLRCTHSAPPPSPHVSS
jgi:hypothetical protein